MPKYLRIFKDAKKRYKYNAKKYRYNKIKQYFGLNMMNQRKSNLTNFCQITGAARSYYAQFAVSRHALRKNAAFGLVPGVMKSSW